MDSPASAAPWQVALLWSIVALLPFWSLFLAHYLRGPHLPTGFICYDLGYYAANGREIFERGNGLGYCNPYDTSPAAPVIYYHWLPWLLGFGIKVLGFDPGGWFLAFGLAAGVAFAFGTFRLAEAILPSRRYLPGLYLLSMWGGGLCVLSAVVCNVAFGLPSDFRLLRFDPFEGLWFLCWGRNCLYATEATYHALVAWAWVGIVRGKPWQGLACIAALAATRCWLDRSHWQPEMTFFAVAAADDNYLLGTYTSLDPYIGHLFLCPDRDARIEAASRWLQTGVKDPVLDVVDVVILSKLRRYPIDFTDWEILCENDRLAALRRWR